MTMRPRAAGHPVLCFGRRAPAFAPNQAKSGSSELGNDLRLFALTFAGGFLFMAVYLG